MNPLDQRLGHRSVISHGSLPVPQMSEVIAWHVDYVARALDDARRTQTEALTALLDELHRPGYRHRLRIVWPKPHATTEWDDRLARIVAESGPPVAYSEWNPHMIHTARRTAHAIEARREQLATIHDWTPDDLSIADRFVADMSASSRHYPEEWFEAVAVWASLGLDAAELSTQADNIGRLCWSGGYSPWAVVHQIGRLLLVDEFDKPTI